MRWIKDAIANPAQSLAKVAGEASTRVASRLLSAVVQSPSEPCRMNNLLADLIGRGFESRDLDYKGPCSWDESNKKACCEIAKDILALGNSGGGHLVFGVAENASGFTPNGLSVEQLRTFESSRINRWVQNYADPPMNCTLSKVDLDGKVYVVIEVPSFAETPHICQKDFPGVLQAGAVYVRTGNNESAPVRSSSDMRRLVELAVRSKQDQLLMSFRAILNSTTVASQGLEAGTRFETQLVEAAATGQEATQYLDENGKSLYTGYCELWSHPNTYRGDLCSLTTLREAARTAGEEFTGWPFLVYLEGEDAPYAISDGIQAAVKHTDFLDQDRADFWQLRQSGFFYQRMLISGETHAKGQGSGLTIDFREFATYVALGIRCVTRLYERLFEESELITIGVRMIGTEGRQLISTQGRLWANYIAKVPEIERRETFPLADWRAGLIDHALEVSDHFFQRFNWASPNLDACKERIEKVLARRAY